MKQAVHTSESRSDTLAVILVSYKQARFIREALDGIRLQTRVPDEVLIADDGSTDDTQDVIRAYVKEHGLEDKWTLLLSPVNRGINANLQGAIDRSRASIIVPMAGDDVSLPNRCAVAEDTFRQHPHINIVTTNGFVIDPDGHVLRPLDRKPGTVSDVSLAIRRGNPLISAVGQSWRRRLFDRFGPLPTDVPNEDDQISFWGLISGGVLCIPDRTFKYRIHDASASAWLRTRQTALQYFDRFVSDMHIRQRHMKHWARHLSNSGLADDKPLCVHALRRADVYGWLATIDKRPLFDRVIFLTKNGRFCSLRDRIYILFGRPGILVWRRCRILLRRA